MLGHRLRRRPNIKPPPGQCLIGIHQSVVVFDAETDFGIKPTGQSYMYRGDS